jgi:hypothetical protein
MKCLGNKKECNPLYREELPLLIELLQCANLLWVSIEGKQDSIIAYTFQILKLSFGRAHPCWDFDESKSVGT